MSQFIRSTATVLFCGIAILAGDAVFRQSLLDRVRPLILTPIERSIMSPPVRLVWEGPSEMRVLLDSPDGTESDLGIRSSPVDLTRDSFGREGGYAVRLLDPQWPSWIHAQRRFQLHFTAPAAAPAVSEPAAEPDESRYLFVALDAARKARDEARAKAREFRHENARLRNETERLQARLDDAYQDTEVDMAEAADLEDEFLALVDELRETGEANVALRFRLANVNPCTVWGYFGFPQPPMTIPPSRRVVRVSNLLGDIFRTETLCEATRRADTSSESSCFCVGDTWRFSP